MEFLPKALGTRPRLAVEVRTDGVVAARAEDAAGLLGAVSRAAIGEGALLPGLKAGNLVDRAGVAGAIRSVLDSVAGRNGNGHGSGAGRIGSGKTRDVTLVVPDAAVRVLLLDFDTLPGKIVEALPVVRFRLKKLLPFEVEDAVVSYQVMSSTKDAVAVLAVAIPRDVLSEYEGAVTAAGYLPGAVLPSTLAALAGLGADSDTDAAALVVNAGAQQVTMAIVRGGVLLLHRVLELSAGMEGGQAERLLLNDGEVDRLDAEAAMQSQVLSEALPVASGSVAGEVAQAVSVAAAYFEDTLGSSPELLLAAGTASAESVHHMLRSSGLEGLRVRELMEPAMLEAGAVSASVPRGWLAGVRGALTS